MSGRCLLRVSVAGFTITGMVSIDYWPLVAGPSVGCIGVLVALSFDVKKVTSVNMPFIRCTEEEVCARRIASIVGSKLKLADNAPATHSLEYVDFTCPHVAFHFLANSDIWFKEIIFEQKFRVRTGSRLFVN